MLNCYKMCREIFTGAFFVALIAGFLWFSVVLPININKSINNDSDILNNGVNLTHHSWTYYNYKYNFMYLHHEISKIEMTNMAHDITPEHTISLPEQNIYLSNNCNICVINFTQPIGNKVISAEFEKKYATDIIDVCEAPTNYKLFKLRDCINKDFENALNDVDKSRSNLKIFTVPWIMVILLLLICWLD